MVDDLSCLFEVLHTDVHEAAAHHFCREGAELSNHVLVSRCFGDLVGRRASTLRSRWPPRTVRFERCELGNRREGVRHGFR